MSRTFEQRPSLTETVHPKRSSTGGAIALPNSPKASKIRAIQHELANSSGRGLDAETRALMESRFGHNFGAVRIHTDTKAASSARHHNAVAYSLGNDVVFDAHHYNPYTFTGIGLLAHELAHVIQQEPGYLAHSATSALEGEADRAGRAINLGNKPRVSLRAPLGIRRQSRPVPAEGVTRDEATKALTEWLNQMLQLQHAMQGDRIRRSLRITERVRLGVMLMFRNDPDPSHFLGIDVYLRTAFFPSQIAEFVRQVARFSARTITGRKYRTFAAPPDR